MQEMDVVVLQIFQGLEAARDIAGLASHEMGQIWQSNQVGLGP